ncbi:MAG: acyl-CoA thioesterase [Pirellulales bacterium]|nr:acyl-CoA thioesterase [Pirellulales bacterium]
MNQQRPTALEAFPVLIELPVQWGDQDSFGHVNNTVYFRWFESARIAYLEQLNLRGGPRGPDPIGPILASIKCDFRRQLTYPDRVLVGARVTRIGRSSIGMAHLVWSRGLEAVAAEGDSTLVVFDYQAGRPHPVPVELRQAIAALQGAVEGA